MAYAIAQQPGYHPAKHLRVLARALMKVESGDITRLMVFMPPRHGKTELASRLFPAWFMGRSVLRGLRRHIIWTSYNQSLANDIGRDVRNNIADPVHQSTFPLPGANLARDSQSISKFHLNDGSAFFAAGIGGSLTGRGAHVLGIDDPVKDAKEAESKTIQENTINWYRAVARTRLAPDAAIVIIQTRWNLNDLSGKLIHEMKEIDGENWHIISLPMICEEETDTLGRKRGEALWPEMFDHGAAMAIKRAVGSRVWNALYQQNPTPDEGNVIKRGWIKYYTVLPGNLDETCASWDMTFKETGNSYVVGQAWGRRDGDFYLMDQTRDRVDFPTSLEMFRQFSYKHPTIIAKYVEDKANGPAIISSVKRTIPGVIPIEPDGDKEARAKAISPLFEAGNIYLPAPEIAPWVGEYVEELCGFPHYKTNDQMDATSQALNKMWNGAGDAAILALYERRFKEMKNASNA